MCKTTTKIEQGRVECFEQWRFYMYNPIYHPTSRIECAWASMLFILNCTSLPEVRRVDIRWRQWSCETSSKKSNEPLRSNLPNVSWFWIVGLLFMKGLLDSKDYIRVSWALPHAWCNLENLSSCQSFAWVYVTSHTSQYRQLSPSCCCGISLQQKNRSILSVGSIDRKKTSEREGNEKLRETATSYTNYQSL